MNLPRSLAFAVLVSQALAACSGSIADDTTADPRASTPPGASPSGKPATGPGGVANTPGTTPTPGAAPGAGGPTGLPASACKAGETAPLPRARLWRLSSEQYVNTVKQLFAFDVPTAALPPDGISEDAITRFDTNADANLVNDRLARVYQDHAQLVAESVVTKLGAGPHACVLDAAAPDACLATFARSYGARAYRRPLVTAELDRMTAYLKSSRKEFDATFAARMMIEALLQSPHFLYRFELGASMGPRVALTSAELASQLAYFLTDAPPDDALLAAAERNDLSSAAGVRAQAERLVASAASRAKLRDFFSHVLLLDELADKPKDAKLFPSFTTSLRRALVGETQTFVDKALFENQGTLETLFSADYSYQNATVAKHYGTTVAGADMVRTALPSGRAGLLSHAGVLAALSGEDGTSPVHRGVYYYQSLLCRPLPIPPADASSMSDRLKDPNNPMGTQREMYTYLQKAAPSCAACHSLFQPMGLSLETFDAIGRQREQEFGKTIDPSVTVAGLGADLDGSYRNGIELGHKIATSQAGRECFVLQYATFGFGRSVDTSAERCRIESLAQRFAQRNHGVQALLVEMTQDDGFYFRSYPQQ